MADRLVKQGRGSRKHGRNRKKPAKMRYTSAKRWITNKARKVFKYMRKHPNWKPTNLSGEVNSEIVKLRKKFKNEM